MGEEKKDKGHRFSGYEHEFDKEIASPDGFVARERKGRQRE